MTVRLPAAIAVVLAVPLLLLSAAAPVTASCALEEFPPGGSPVVFSGTVMEERGTYARFEVDRVWVGPDLADEVWVQGGTEQTWWPLSLVQQVSSSTDAQFEVGQDYVVGASDDFSTNICSMTEAEGVAVPDDARTPTSDGAQGADPPLSPVAQTAIAATLVAALVLLVVVAWRRRRGAQGRTRSGTQKS